MSTRSNLSSILSNGSNKSTGSGNNKRRVRIITSREELEEAKDYGEPLNIVVDAIEWELSRGIISVKSLMISISLHPLHHRH